MDWIEGFTQDCQARGMTRHAIETYRSQVKAFLEAYDKPTEVDLDQLRLFLMDLRACLKIRYTCTDRFPYYDRTE